ncbi:rab-GTPase-TBC domain-containing protein [Neohortaea acidophila]|uniref:GTPase-activating protein GYP5 n=1 Tax=Neohortaea acidophila TaxID=245834 RepID=A0A6A6PGF4_9PEZI|nr:rab-GTPase-TBC domain-containing protein [Neohortaea acidophila]KAF2479068.1 rab-GTPase-TBC domain-containing protein [Neohortaea acidophila]
MSNGGESLATIDDDAEDTGTPRRPTLQAQFLNLRKQEESSSPATNGHDDADKDERAPIERTTSDAGLNGSLGDNLNIKTARSLSTPGPLKSPSLSLNLPPGTASGLEAGPAEEPRPVNWDLWQSVVCEGPAAVARTSGEELNQAIASGIPAAIRGVVWQVLADSKSPEMEDLYRTLKARGTAADVEQQQQQRPAPVSRQASQSVLFNTTEPPEKDWEVASSKSSVHSEHSTPATSTLPSQTSPPPSVIGDDADAQARAKALAEQNKQEAAALTKLEKAIRRDLGSRTSFSKYAQAAGLQDGLFGLCKAYALLDDAVGYPQGVNFIAMPLLFNMTEEEAFTLLVRLMSKYDVRSMFTGDLSGLHLRLYQFERLLEDRDPALYCHLRRRNVGPQLYATQWFLTLFAYRFPLQLVLRVYDLIFSQGLTAILKFGLALMQHNRVALLEMKDMSQLTTFLKDKLFDAYIDKSPSASSLLEGGFFGSVSGGADKEVYRADEMVRDACDVDISDAVLASYTAEWEETQRQTQEREAELENLRTSNGTLSARVKVLEERTEQQDNDHVSIAGDVVRIKVENDGLLDENEELKVKVEELQKLVDSQPAELEAKFKEEMARVLERNSEVQSENRVLKEEVEEMEKALVDIKLKHAQAQQDHDELTRKWMNVQALLKS